jgi:hypothetical protein
MSPAACPGLIVAGEGITMRAIVVAVGVTLAVALSVPATASVAVAGTTPTKASASPEHPLFDVSCASPRYCVAREVLGRPV